MTVIAYSRHSGSAKNLAEALGVKRISHRKTTRRYSQRKLLINWGNTKAIKDQRDIRFSHELNLSAQFFVDKLTCFKRMKDAGVSIPEFYESLEEVPKDGKTYFARKSLTGNSGAGIVPFKSCKEGEEQAIDAPQARLYTQYVPKKEEYRVHVFNGEPIFVQRKARRLDTPDEDVNWQVRNHSNGFIFASDGVELPQEALGEAIKAVRCLNLDFGAVDLVYNEKRNKYYVLEVNTAPGLTGNTLEAYVNAINKYKQERNLL